MVLLLQPNVFHRREMKARRTNLTNHKEARGQDRSTTHGPPCLFPEGSSQGSPSPESGLRDIKAHHQFRSYSTTVLRPKDTAGVTAQPDPRSPGQPGRGSHTEFKVVSLQPYHTFRRFQMSHKIKTSNTQASLWSLLLPPTHGRQSCGITQKSLSLQLTQLCSNPVLPITSFATLRRSGGSAGPSPL